MALDKKVKELKEQLEKQGHEIENLKKVLKSRG
jgi:hypothetical protein